MKLPWIAIGLSTATIIVGASLSYAWDRTRFRTVTYRCTEGPKEIALVWPGDFLFSVDSPSSDEFYMSGFVDQGKVTVVGFPADDAPPDGPKVLHFESSRERISEARTGDWYSAPVSVRFEPDTPLAECWMDIVYRMRGIF
jgi:hypothetical protein